MIRPHPYSPDSSATDRPGGKPRQCVLCGMPEKNKIHVEATVNHTARIVGDKEGSDV